MWRLGSVCGDGLMVQWGISGQSEARTGVGDQSEARIVMTQSEIENMNNEYVNSIHYHQLHSQLHPPPTTRAHHSKCLISSFSCVDLSSSIVNLADRVGPLFCCLVSWPIQFTVTLNQVSRMLGHSLSPWSLWWLMAMPWPRRPGRQ